MARSAAAPIGVSKSSDVSRETFPIAGAAPSPGDGGAWGATGAGAGGCTSATPGDGEDPADQSCGELTLSSCLPSVPDSGAPAFRVALTPRLRADANSSRHMSPP